MASIFDAAAAGNIAAMNCFLDPDPKITSCLNRVPLLLAVGYAGCIWEMFVKPFCLRPFLNGRGEGRCLVLLVPSYPTLAKAPLCGKQIGSKNPEANLGMDELWLDRVFLFARDLKSLKLFNPLPTPPWVRDKIVTRQSHFVESSLPGCG